ncbi:hypothetical protein KGF56_000220 [Candida oxycetoniae]|uniref:Myb-like domain-containing protein n=1 Tax=Candida oxycetoniae TaxID=497107 RepID=A0AAI9T129_9ASCO|nr:uncharacterized protein KGF56_000220 [Candida oxycetoniae]KAI3406928.2 hypothetical protein KGF56_000220 [Candida oxycetoniae]
MTKQNIIGIKEHSDFASSSIQTPNSFQSNQCVQSQNSQYQAFPFLKSEQKQNEAVSTVILASNPDFTINTSNSYESNRYVGDDSYHHCTHPQHDTNTFAQHQLTSSPLLPLKLQQKQQQQLPVSISEGSLNYRHLKPMQFYSILPPPQAHPLTHIPQTPLQSAQYQDNLQPQYNYYVQTHPNAQFTFQQIQPPPQQQQPWQPQPQPYIPQSQQTITSANFPQAYYHSSNNYAKPISAPSRRKSKQSTTWSAKEDRLLRELKEVQNLGWRNISTFFQDRTPNACQFRWRRIYNAVKGSSSSSSPPTLSSSIQPASTISTPKYTSPSLQSRNSMDSTSSHQYSPRSGDGENGIVADEEKKSQHNIDFLLN